ncbi:nucleotidyl cyclase domain-containing protein [Streptomyces litchfieldiae]|uniref:Uncharacterized protein n=1 Tax=Streptomyces litchfieldiae TaxID=3075543 RepID=A0ABU2MKP5_9ACTN|nr:hypothetical protein [Streptomyces sp. DSM 44938]MDT0342012.1 hypothetical protein [Streptomyces sp. DSM 44938]
MTEPLHQTILLADIEGSGRSDDVVRRVKRHHMYEVVQCTLDAAGVSRTDQRLEDRGDGVLALVSAAVPKAALLRAMLTEIPARLHDYNRIAADSSRVRLRTVLAAGEVALDEIPGALGGVIGWDLDQAFRLLDSEPLRAELRRRRDSGGTGEDAVICVSEAVFGGVVRHDHHGIRRAAFHPFTVEGKEGPVRGWLYGEPTREREPAGNEEHGGHAGPASRPGGARPPAGAVFNGPYVAGNQYGVSGGQVGGDVVMGNKIVGDGTGGERP